MSRVTSQLIGRDEVVREVGERLAVGTSCVIRGDAGIGKSAVMRAIRARSAKATATGAGLPALTYVPYGALRQPLPDLPSPAAASATSAASDVADRLADRQLVIEDLHWCDADTIEVLLQLCLVRPVLATARLSPSLADPLIARINEVGHTVTLPPLDDEAARELVSQARPGAIPSDVNRWIQAAGGNPLLLEVAATHGSAPNAGDPLAALTSTIPSHLILPAARLALVGRPLAIHAVPETAELVELGLAVTSGATVSIRHDLLGAAVVALISDGERAALHGALATELDDPAERARHFDAAGRRQEAAAAGRLAAGMATSVTARAECLRIAATNTETRHDPGLAVEAADALTWASRFPPALELIQTDGSWWGEHSTHRMMVLVRVNAALGNFEAEIQAIDAGLELLAQSGTDEEVELLTLKARYLARVGWKHAEAIELADRALAMASTDAMRMMALSARGSSAMAVGDPSWETNLEAAIDIADRTNDPLGAALADSMFIGLLLNGDARRCEPLALRGIERWGGDLSYWDAQFRKNALLAAFHIAGDYGRVLDEGPRLLARPIAHRAREHLEATLILAYSDTGDDQRAMSLAASAVGRDTPDLTARSMYLWSLAEAHFQMGNLVEAASVAQSCVEVPLPGFPGFTNGAVIGAYCRLARGEPISDTDVELARSSFTNLAGAHLECAAIRALSTGANGEAADIFELAATSWRRMSRRSALRCEIAAGAAARRDGQLDRSRRLLAAAAAETRAMGAQRLAGWAQRALRRSGSSPNEVAGHGARRARGSTDLTTRELEVLALVGRGLRTPEIRAAPLAATFHRRVVRSLRAEEDGCREPAASGSHGAPRGGPAVASRGLRHRRRRQVRDARSHGRARTTRPSASSPGSRPSRGISRRSA